jgi:DNA invertase Pin-like site-specific DNA recombinase
MSRDVEYIAGLMKRHKFRVASMHTTDTFQLHIYAVLAEQERTFIRERG